MRTKIDPTKATHLFFPQKDRVCPGCGEPQRYDYKSSGRYFYLLFGLNFLEGQIVCCHNGHCALRYKPMHPAEELAYVPTKKGHGFDVIARVGQHRYGDKLTRLEILARLEKEYPDLVISERQVENLYKLYCKLVSDSTLMDREVIAAMKGNKVIVLSLDGAKPIRNNDSVWFVRDVVSGITLAAQVMTSCTTGHSVRRDAERLVQTNRLLLAGSVPLLR